MASKTEAKLKWGIRKRLEFIEFRLFWYGKFNRPDLANTFGISNQQATKDISAYQVFAQNNCFYDSKEKSYVRTPDFQANLIGKSTDRYLLQLVAIKNGWMEKGETWFGELPPVEVISLKRRPVDPIHLQAIQDGIRTRIQLEIGYQSLTGSEASKRTIAPHSMTFSEGRWYVRAWNKEHNNFRDYNLNRISTIEKSGPSNINVDLDYQWVQKINFNLIPNPELSVEKRTAIENEHNMENGALIIPVRLSNAFYLMDQYNLDVGAGILKPEKQQLILKNKEDVESACRLAKKMSSEALKRNLDQ